MKEEEKQEDINVRGEKCLEIFSPDREECVVAHTHTPSARCSLANQDRASGLLRSTHMSLRHKLSSSLVFSSMNQNSSVNMSWFYEWKTESLSFSEEEMI